MQTVIAPEQVGDLLLSLAEKSLVYPDPVGNETRYRLLESTRYFAAEKLGPAADIRRRHAEHFLDRFSVATAEWEASPTVQWIVRYEPRSRHPGALEWAFGESGDLSLGQSAGHSHVLWAELALVQEHRHWVDRALGNVCNVTPEIMARLLSWQAGDVREIDDPTDYEEAMRAVKLYRKVGDGFQEGALLRAVRHGYRSILRRRQKACCGKRRRCFAHSVPRRRCEMPKRPGVRSVIRRRHRQGAKTAR